MWVDLLHIHFVSIPHMFSSIENMRIVLLVALTVLRCNQLHTVIISINLYKSITKRTVQFLVTSILMRLELVATCELQLHKQFNRC